jgi:AraC family transcriptional regulator
MIIHKGPYEACSPANERLFTGIEEQGLRITGLVREVELNDPREVPPWEMMSGVLVALK